METITPGYVRVSTILSTWTDFSKIDPYVLAAKCKAGTEVHEWIKYFYLDDIYPIGEKAEQYIPAFKCAYATELNEYRPLIHEGEPFIEKRLYSKKLGITGMMDGVFMHDGKPVLIDYKTSYAANIPVWTLQMALYALLLAHNGLAQEIHAKVLHLKKNGSYRLISMNLDASTISLARSAVKLYHWFHPQG